MNKNVIFVIVGLVVIGGGSFYAGMKYDQNKSTATISTGNRFGGARGMRGTNGGFVAGEILAKDAMSITLKLQDGSSKIILVSNSTPIMKSVEGTPTDLAIGKQVTVTGSLNSDGSLTAQSIQMRPASSTRNQ